MSLLYKSPLIKVDSNITKEQFLVKIFSLSSFVIIFMFFLIFLINNFVLTQLKTSFNIDTYNILISIFSIIILILIIISTKYDDTKNIKLVDIILLKRIILMSFIISISIDYLNLEKDDYIETLILTSVIYISTALIIIKLKLSENVFDSLTPLLVIIVNLLIVVSIFIKIFKQKDKNYIETLNNLDYFTILISIILSMVLIFNIFINFNTYTIKSNKDELTIDLYNFIYLNAITFINLFQKLLELKRFYKK